MKWKDTGGGEAANPEKSDPYYEDDGYSSFKEKGLKKAAILSGNPVRYLYWGIGIAVVAGVVLLVLLLFSNINESTDLARISALEQKIEQLEQRLEKQIVSKELIQTAILAINQNLPKPLSKDEQIHLNRILQGLI